MSTKNNLMAAFAGESQANKKYTAFAQKADEEGYPRIAKLFRAAAAAETVHALKEFEAAGEIGTTEENLKAAIEGETHEFENMYPAFIEEAKKDGDDLALMAFENANAVEKIHAGLYKKALANMDDQNDISYFVCPVCGNTVENGAPDECPICGVPKDMFFEVQ